MGVAQTIRHIDEFFKENLPFGTARYIGKRYVSLINRHYEFRFERCLKGGKPDLVCIVPPEETLVGSEAVLQRFLDSTKDPTFGGLRRCTDDVRRKSSGGGRPLGQRSALRRWSRR